MHVLVSISVDPHFTWRIWWIRKLCFPARLRRRWIGDGSEKGEAASPRQGKRRFNILMISVISKLLMRWAEDILAQFVVELNYFLEGHITRTKQCIHKCGAVFKQDLIWIDSNPNSHQLPNLGLEAGKAADDDVWGWDGSGAHVLQPDDGRTEVCGTFQMQICHERTLEEREGWEGGRKRLSALQML